MSSLIWTETNRNREKPTDERQTKIDTQTCIQTAGQSQKRTDGQTGRQTRLTMTERDSCRGERGGERKTERD